MRTDVLRISAECYAGHREEETPRRFRLPDHDAETVEVVEILDRWLSPDHRYFKVRGGDGHTYILRHDTASGAWELTMYAGRP